MSKHVRFTEGHVIKPRMEIEMERNKTKQNKKERMKYISFIQLASPFFFCPGELDQV